MVWQEVFDRSQSLEPSGGGAVPGGDSVFKRFTNSAFQGDGKGYISTQIQLALGLPST